VAWAPPRTPLGKLTTLFRPPSWTWRSLFSGEGKERIRKRSRRKKEATEEKERKIGPRRIGLVCAL